MNHLVILGKEHSDVVYSSTIQLDSTCKLKNKEEQKVQPQLVVDNSVCSAKPLT